MGVVRAHSLMLRAGEAGSFRTSTWGLATLDNTQPGIYAFYNVLVLYAC